MRSSKTFKNQRRLIWISCLAAAGGISLGSCSSVKSMFAMDPPPATSGPIQNPFGELYPASGAKEKDNIVLRTKKGDRAVEIELPGGDQSMTDFVVPVSPAFRDGGRGLASVPGAMSAPDDSYKQVKPTAVDREITGTFPQVHREDENKQREIEQGLGVVAAEDQQPEADSSYLAAVDHIKQMFKGARYEAALIEIDQLLHQYQTDPKLYEMRGTILDRLGYTDLALKSWTQALRFDPSNLPLKNFVDRRAAKRGIAASAPSSTGGASP
jgi:tetratricopeptide (TPR) repeat protein